MGNVINISDLMSSRPGYISLAKDHNPYTTLLYGNGPGAHSTRADLRNVDTSNHQLYATYCTPTFIREIFVIGSREPHFREYLAAD